MWIRFKKTYAGPLGGHAKGDRIDIDDRTVKLLPKGVYEKCRAPWEDQVDEKAKDISRLQQELTKAGQKFEKLQAANKKAAETADLRKIDRDDKERKKAELTKEHDFALAAAKKAHDKLVKKPRSKKEKAAAKKAAELESKAEQVADALYRIELEANKAQGLCEAAYADEQLAVLDVAAAKREVEELAGKFNKAAKSKTKKQ